MICLAKIVAVKGVKGDVKVKSFTSDPLALERYKVFYDKTGNRKIPLTLMRREKDYFLGHLEGVNSREEAFLFKGQELFVPREDLPDLETGEFYHSDLVGLAARNLETKEEGAVLAVRNYGAEDLLDISIGGKNSVLIPFRDEYVPEVNLKKGYLTYKPLFSVNAPEEEDEFDEHHEETRESDDGNF